ncbi:aldehyde dehydrogenase family protein [Phenylobacterium sp.]|uniref:L-piperidine-6-carboxylate dehydrogenase n=1 Tax=Phenylobacterium sp. TaxID=1871053 RepID=UPI0035236E54
MDTMSLPTCGLAASRVLGSLGVSHPVRGVARLSPIDESPMPPVETASLEEVDQALVAAQAAFETWRLVPAPRRGELVRRFGEVLRDNKAALGELVMLEAGKSLSEGLGEVQEMIDICDFAVGLSRQLYGLTIASERPMHHMREAWHPLGVVAIISAFNFPVAVWAWNAALALVCGDTIVWKPSEKTPLTAVAAHALLQRVVAEFPEAPAGLSALLLGDGEIGAALSADHRVALVSATGSTRMGRAVGVTVAERFGRSLLELGGNGATVVCPSADLELAVRAIAFGAAGTAGQRCTTMRRLLVHGSIYDDLLPRLTRVFRELPVGDPRLERNIVGPLVDGDALRGMATALDRAKRDGGIVHGGEALGGLYARPAIVELASQTQVVREETFAPILYVLRYETLDQAVALLRDVPQGLSSSIITNDLREAETFLSAAGSDCGIANVNMGTSGAEIGGAFGGEKETGGGRESGSDAWKAYMRRQTQCINYGRDLPLAQGVAFATT